MSRSSRCFLARIYRCSNLSFVVSKYQKQNTTFRRRGFAFNSSRIFQLLSCKGSCFDNVVRLLCFCGLLLRLRIHPELTLVFELRDCNVTGIYFPISVARCYFKFEKFVNVLHANQRASKRIITLQAKFLPVVIVPR